MPGPIADYVSKGRLLELIGELARFGARPDGGEAHLLSGARVLAAAVAQQAELAAA
jgi:hypothetical protein